MFLRSRYTMSWCSVFSSLSPWSYRSLGNPCTETSPMALVLEFRFKDGILILDPSDGNLSDRLLFPTDAPLYSYRKPLLVPHYRNAGKLLQVSVLAVSKRFQKRLLLHTTKIWPFCYKHHKFILAMKVQHVSFEYFTSRGCYASMGQGSKLGIRTANWV